MLKRLFRPSDATDKGLVRLFMSHPPINERIEALRRNA